MLHPFTDNVEFTLEGGIVVDTGVASDQNLPEDRFAGLRRRPDMGIVDGYVAPAQ